MYDSPEQECEEIIRRLKEHCRLQNISMHELSEKSGVAISTLNGMFHLKTKPQLYTLLKICCVLEISVGELFPAKSNFQGYEERLQKILRIYRALPRWKQERMEEYAEMLLIYVDNTVNRSKKQQNDIDTNEKKE